MGRVVRCFVLVVVLVLSVAAAASADVPFVRPDHAVRELVGDRTAESRTWEMPSGQHVTQLASDPVQWKDGQGDWRAYDLSLRADAGGWSAQSGKAALSFPAKLDSGMDGGVRVVDGSGAAMTMSFLGAAADGALSNDVAVYRNVAHGVDLAMRAMPGGVKEDLVLEDADASRELSYRVSVSSDDLALVNDGIGGLRVVQGKATVFVIPAPSLTDASGAPGLGARFEVKPDGDRSWVVTMKLDQKWLDAPRRAWPVVVDPTVQTLQSPSTWDCSVATVNDSTTSATPNGQYAACNTYDSRPMGVYPYDRYTDDRSELLRFDTLTPIQSDAIDSAQLQLDQLFHAGSRPLEVRGIKVGWDGTTLPWRTTADWAEAAPAATIPTGPDGPLTADLTALVTQWHSWEASGGTQGVQNHGIVVDMQGVAYQRCDCDGTGGGGEQPTVQSSLSSSISPAPTPRPMLQVRSWPAAPAGDDIVTPVEGDLTAKRIPLQARALASSVTTARFQYIAGNQRTWTDIPLAALSTSTRGSVSSTSIPVTGSTGDRRSNLVVWDLGATPGGEADGPVHVRAWLDSPVAGEGGMTREVNFRVDRRGIDGAASEPIGPGNLDLLSGGFTMQQTDASIRSFLQDLTLTRTYESRGVAVRNADMFGPGWSGNVEPDGGDVAYKSIYDYSQVKNETVDRQVLNPDDWDWEAFFETFDTESLGADIETVQTTEAFNYHYAVVETGDGRKFTFTQITDPRGNVTDWDPDDDHPGYSLARATTSTPGVVEYTLTDPDGNIARFRSEVADSPNAPLAAFQQPGSPSALSYAYEASGTRQRLKTVTAPMPSGGRPRSLNFTWTSVGTTPTPRVTDVTFTDGYGDSVPIASYSYDATARLIQATNSTIAGGVRFTRYHYNGSGQLAQVTPSGEATWNLAYTTIAGESGPRLTSVSRAHPDGGTATRTIAYNVPLSGAGAPYDMSTTQTATWAQTDDLPWDAVAIWPEDTVPDLRSPDYRKATIYYVGVQGREVNVAEPGGAITTETHDSNGNVIRELSAQGRSVALAAGTRSATVAVDRSTLSVYASNGVDLLATKEPVTQITLSDGRVVTGRRVQSTVYDAGAPAGGPYHLPTSDSTYVESGGQPLDSHTTTTYDYASNGGMSGWTARHATKTIVDPNGRALTSYSILHPTYPVVEETRTPGAPAGGTTPDDQWYQYYGITASARVPSGLVAAGCNSFTSYLNPPGFLCLRSEATLPDASVPRRWSDYNVLGQVTTVFQPRPLQWFGTGSRETAHSYDTAGQQTGVAVTGGTGTSVPSAAFTYDPATGKQTQASSSNGTIRRVFDSNGRLSQYTDAAGTVTSYRYDLRGRQTSMTVDGATTTYGYDDRDNLISVTDPGIGSAITGTYDLDDNLASETTPNGLVMAETYDETDRPFVLTWTKTSGCSSNCTWIRSEIDNRDRDGRTVVQRTNNTQETLTYDTVGRLSRDDAVKLSNNSCVRKTYTYDGGGAGDSNRTSTTAWTGTAGGACGTGTSSTRALTYDNADRVSSSGWSWDYFGRATDVPAADSGGTGALTAAYFADDRVRALTLDGRTHTYTRDALDRTTTIDSSGASKPTLTSTYRYSDDTDEPSQITLSDSSTIHDIEGPGGDVIATNTNGTAVYDLSDIQGSIVATAPVSGTPTASTEYDPFGKVSTATPNVINWTKGLPANGWLGAKQRPTDFGQTGAGAAGPIEMGARVYLPKIGRFLQVDPIDGGSLNDYDYANQDPADEQDLSGLASANGHCIRGTPAFRPKLCKAAGFNIVDKTYFRKDHDKWTAWHKACWLAGGALLAAQPESGLLKIAFRVFGGSQWLACS